MFDHKHQQAQQQGIAFNRLIIVVAITGLLIVAGWFMFASDSNRPTSDSDSSSQTDATASGTTNTPISDASGVVAIAKSSAPSSWKRYDFWENDVKLSLFDYPGDVIDFRELPNRTLSFGTYKKSSNKKAGSEVFAQFTIIRVATDEPGETIFADTDSLQTIANASHEANINDKKAGYKLNVSDVESTTVAGLKAYTFTTNEGFALGYNAIDDGGLTLTNGAKTLRIYFIEGKTGNILRAIIDERSSVARDILATLDMP